MPKHEPISDKEVTALRAEYQHLLEENDALRIENVDGSRLGRSVSNGSRSVAKSLQCPCAGSLATFRAVSRAAICASSSRAS